MGPTPLPMQPPTIVDMSAVRMKGMCVKRACKLDQRLVDFFATIRRIFVDEQDVGSTTRSSVCREGERRSTQIH